jgi:hypothetical protein
VDHPLLEETIDLFGDQLVAGGIAAPTARAAQAMAFEQSFIGGHHNSLVGQHL